jgi:hypothetical protein
MTLHRSAFVLVLLVLISSAGGNVKDLASTLPDRVLDWTASGKDMVYDRTTLFDYLDGGAEVYLAFGYREVLVRKFADAAKNEINLDIYDMGSSAEAFGIFSCDRQDPGAGIGQESEYGPGLLRFYQGRYFVSITVSGDEAKAEAAILELGRKVAPKLGPSGPPPELLKFLPAAGLKNGRTSFFHNAVHLSNRYFVAAENILNLDTATECAFAEYVADSGEAGSLLLIRYPDRVKAKAAAESFLKSYLPEADAQGAALTENKKWTMTAVRESFVAVVFEATSKKFAADILAAVTYPTK